jgi:glycosyltransferase involved in cell wall biosynthesis
MRYLAAVTEAAQVHAEFFYIDHPGLMRTSRHKRAAVTLGSLQSALRIASRRPRGERLVVHVNTSLYARSAFRDAPVLLAAHVAGLPILLQIHGGRFDTLSRQGGLAFAVWKRLLELPTAIGSFPGPQWEELERAGYGSRLCQIDNVVPTSGATAAQGTDARILFLGRLTEEKGAREVLDAYLRVKDRHGGEATLTIAGDGPLSDELQARAAASHHTDTIAFEGFAQGDRLRAIVAHANTFVLPSREEAFPLAFLECAERGMACLVTTNSAIPYMFAEGKEYLPLDPARKDDLFQRLLEIVSSPGLRAGLGAAARDAVRARFTIDVAAPRFRELYESLALPRRR